MNKLAVTITACLKTARLLPPQHNSSNPILDHLDIRDFRQLDLLPQLVHLWKIAAQTDVSRKEKTWCQQRWQWLKECHQQGDQLLMDTSSYFGDGFQQWLGCRFVWYPGGVPRRQRVGIASSRLGKRLDEKPAWFQTLRNYCKQLDRATQLLFTVSGTAAAPYVMRAAQLFNLPCLQTTIIDSSRWRYWGQLVWNTASVERHPVSWSAIVSPVIDPVVFPVTPKKLENTPAQDRMLISASEKLLVCHLRPQGILQQLIKHRLTSFWSTRSSIELKPPRPLVKQCELVHPQENAISPSDMTDRAPNIDPGNNTKLLRRPWQYLTHWTRRQDGPWPDQNHDDWLDELILEQPDRARSALASLQRIVRQQQLLATDTCIRGGHQVVCFTAVPLSRWSCLHTYQAHRGRRDFEPYGLCIKRTWLEPRGIQPVVYGGNEDWNQLTKQERPFFQHRFGNKSSVTTRRDWSVEEEWRHPGTLSLKHLPGKDCFLFVPTKRQATLLANDSRWPIIYLGTNFNLLEQSSG